MLPVACGPALAAQLRGEGRVAAAFTGDGATSEGDFHEALNLASYSPQGRLLPALRQLLAY